MFNNKINYYLDYFQALLINCKGEVRITNNIIFIKYEYKVHYFTEIKSNNFNFA